MLRKFSAKRVLHRTFNMQLQMRAASMKKMGRIITPAPMMTTSNSCMLQLASGNTLLLAQLGEDSPPCNCSGLGDMTCQKIARHGRKFHSRYPGIVQCTCAFLLLRRPPSPFDATTFVLFVDRTHCCSRSWEQDKERSFGPQLGP